MKCIFKCAIVLSLLFLVGCGGKSDSSAPVVGPGPSDGGAGGGAGGSGGGAPGGAPGGGSSGPVVNPSRSFEIVNPADGTIIKGSVSESGAIISLQMPQISYRLKTLTSSANLRFINEENSLRKGCANRAERIASNQEREMEFSLNNPGRNNPYTFLLENERTILKYEAGVFSLTTETREISEPLKILAIDAARNLGFSNVRSIYLNSLSEVNINYEGSAFVLFIDQDQEFLQSLRSILFVNLQQRLLIGELCDLLLGKVDLRVYDRVNEPALGRAKVQINLQDY